MKDLLSIIIVNWNSKDFVRACIDSVRNSVIEIEYEIIVVDGASFDGCCEMLEDVFPEVRYIQSDENLGFGRCNNLAVQSARGSTLLLINPDTEVQPCAIQSLYLALKNLPTAGMVGARLLNTDGSLQTSCVQSFPTPLNQALDSEFLRNRFPRLSLWGTWSAFNSTEPTSVQGLSGACLMLTKETFERVGRFSEEFFMYGEDMDLSWKVRDAGFLNYHVPSAVVLHHGGGCTGGAITERGALWMRQAVGRCIQKQRGMFIFCLYKFVMGVSAMTRLLMLYVSGVMRFVSNSGGTNRNSILKWNTILRWSLSR